MAHQRRGQRARQLCQHHPYPRWGQTRGRFQKRRHQSHQPVRLGEKAGQGQGGGQHPGQRHPGRADGGAQALDARPPLYQPDQDPIGQRSRAGHRAQHRLRGAVGATAQKSIAGPDHCPSGAGGGPGAGGGQ